MEQVERGVVAPGLACGPARRGLGPFRAVDAHNHAVGMGKLSP